MSVPLHADSMGSSVDEINRRLRNLEQSNPFENSAIFNGALKVFDSNGNLTMQIGLQADGTYGLRAYNPTTGAVVLQLGPQTDGTNGLGVSDPSGVKQVQLGQLPGGAGLYGLSVLNGATGTLQLVAGASSAIALATQITTSTSYIGFADDPVVTAVVGSSGSALVGYGGRIGTGGVNEQGSIAASVDGVVSPTAPVSVSTGATGGVQGSGMLTRVLTGLTPGSHAFSLRYAVGNPAGGVAFSARVITVLPL